MFRRHFKQITMAFAMLLMFAGLPAVAKDQTVLRLNLTISQQDPVYAYWQKFARKLEDESNNTLQIKVYPTESLGKTVDMIQAIKSGAPILQDTDPSYLEDYVPDYTIFMAPYLFNKPKDINTAFESDLGQRMESDLRKQGIRTVTMVYFGTRNMMCDAPVHKRSDTKGLKIRVADTKMWNWTGEVLGGIVINTAWSEVYTALSEGLADCMGSPVNVVYGMGFQDILGYYILTEHLIAPTSIVMSQKVYESLPSDAQRAIDKIGHAYPAVRRKQITALESEYRRKLADAGVTIISDVDKSAFVKKASHVGDHFPKWTPGLYHDMKEIIAR